LHVDIMPDTVARIQVILEAAKRHKVDFLLQMGDLMYPDAAFLKAHAPESLALREQHAWFVCDRDDEKTSILNMIRDSGIPLYGVLGNHDMDSCSKKTACMYLNIPSPYYYFDMGGIRFLILDTNIFRDNETYIDFDHNNYRYYESSQRGWIPEEQLAFIENTAMESPYPCVLLSHASLGLSIHNMPELHALIGKLNHGRRRTVLALNGHHHIDGVCVRSGVPMMDINSASNVWIGHEYDSVRYSETICRLYPHIKGCAPYWDALFAVIEIDENAITVTGRTSSYVGADPYELGYPGRPKFHRLSPCIQSRVLPMTEMQDTDHL